MANTTPSSHIRIATEADVGAVAALFDAYRQFYGQPPDLALARRFVAQRIANQDSTILLAAGADGRGVGMCQLYPSFCSVLARPIYTLYDLFVAADERRAGTGRRLLRAAEQHARRNGIARMDLGTARSNLPAQALYAALGWQRDDVFLNYSLAIGP